MFKRSSSRKNSNPQQVRRRAARGTDAAGAAGAARTASSPVEPLESRILLAGMTAKLYAGNIDLWGPTYTFKVTYSSDKRIRPSSVDNNDILITGPNGYTRLAKFISMVDNLRTITARYKVVTPRNLWEPNANGTYTFKMMGNQVKDLAERYVPSGILGSFVAKVPPFPTTVGEQDYRSGRGAINVKDFGANPDDNIDDTDAIQNAIDSLPRGNGVPTGRDPMGGIVFLPKGTYKISRPLLISSAIVLRGEGSLTVLNGVSANAGDSVIRVFSPYWHGFMVRAGVQNLKITSDVSKGIDVDASMEDGDVIGLKFTNLTMSTGGAGIDMRGKDIYQSTVENVTFINMGSAALAMTWTRELGNAAINYIHNVVITGLGRSNFVSDEAMVILNGDFNVDGLDIGDIGKKILPLSCYRGVNLRSLVLRAGTNNLPNGVLAKFDNGVFQLDWLDNIGPGRTLQFTRSKVSNIGKLKLANNATVNNALSIDSDSHVAVEALQSATLTTLNGVDAKRFSTKSLTGIDATRRANVIVNTKLDGPASKLFVDATDFGVVANDGIDDTAALQAAIDSLPRGDGIPGLNGDVGGTVFLPRGRIDLSGTIKLPSGVWLVGQGNATALYNTSLDTNGAAILLVSGALAGYNNGAGITDLGLYTENTAGIRGDSALNFGVFDLTIDSITLSAGGCGIDLRGCRTYSATINGIGAYGPGSSIIYIGDNAGYSSDNRINDVQVYGDARPNYRVDRALLVFRGENVIENVWCENFYNDSLLLYVSGRANIWGLWMEPQTEHVVDKITSVFENIFIATIDKLYFVDELRQLKFINSNVHIDYMNIAGRTETLQETITLDATTRLTLGTVNAIYDVGMSDDPRVYIGGVYNQNAEQYVDNVRVMTGSNLMQQIGSWTVQWGDGHGAVIGTASIEQTAQGPRLKITVISNPNNRPVQVTINASVPASAIGKPAGASWRVDGGGPNTLVWTRDYGQQFWGRNNGSTTVVPMPGVLTGNDQILILLNNFTGTAYVSNVRLVALS